MYCEAFSKLTPLSLCPCRPEDPGPASWSHVGHLDNPPPIVYAQQPVAEIPSHEYRGTQPTTHTEFCPHVYVKLTSGSFVFMVPRCLSCPYDWAMGGAYRA
jgi:hypothetical protein